VVVIGPVEGFQNIGNQIAVGGAAMLTRQSPPRMCRSSGFKKPHN
jgi:hypothetical protein